MHLCSHILYYYANKYTYKSDTQENEIMVCESGKVINQQQREPRIEIWYYNIVR